MGVHVVADSCGGDPRGFLRRIAVDVDAYAAEGDVLAVVVVCLGECAGVGRAEVELGAVLLLPDCILPAPPFGPVLGVDGADSVHDPRSRKFVEARRRSRLTSGAASGVGVGEVVLKLVTDLVMDEPVNATASPEFVVGRIGDSVDMEQSDVPRAEKESVVE